MPDLPDIVARLRHPDAVAYHRRDRQEAADEIERLRRENAVLSDLKLYMQDTVSYMQVLFERIDRLQAEQVKLQAERERANDQ